MRISDRPGDVERCDLPAARAPFMPSGMTGGSGKSGDGKRNERLAAALRENLKRRKAQAKGRSAKGGADRAGTARAAAQKSDKAD
jgi:hypothetical protein